MEYTNFSAKVAPVVQFSRHNDPPTDLFAILLTKAPTPEGSHFVEADSDRYARQPVRFALPAGGTATAGTMYNVREVRFCVEEAEGKAVKWLALCDDAGDVVFYGRAIANPGDDGGPEICFPSGSIQLRRSRQ